MKMTKERFEQIVNEYYSHSPPLKFCLGVDFDKTLCFSDYPYAGPETPVCDFIRSVQDMDIVIIITTCRDGNESEEIAKEWLKAHGIRYDYYNENDKAHIELLGECRKIFCNMLIDDCSFDFNMNDFVKDGEKT